MLGVVYFLFTDVSTKESLIKSLQGFGGFTRTNTIFEQRSSIVVIAST